MKSKKVLIPLIVVIVGVLGRSRVRLAHIVLFAGWWMVPPRTHRIEVRLQLLNVWPPVSGILLVHFLRV